MQLYNWYKHLSKERQKFGYLVNGSKSWLIVKSGELAKEAKRVFGEEVNKTTEGQRHLGAVIDLIHKWRPIYNSFVEVQISLPSLDTIQ